MSRRLICTIAPYQAFVPLFHVHLLFPSATLGNALCVYGEAKEGTVYRLLRTVSPVAAQSTLTALAGVLVRESIRPITSSLLYLLCQLFQHIGSGGSKLQPSIDLDLQCTSVEPCDIAQTPRYSANVLF